jgi:hypothetical protein
MISIWNRLHFLLQYNPRLHAMRPILTNETLTTDSRDYTCEGHTAVLFQRIRAVAVYPQHYSSGRFIHYNYEYNITIYF